MRLDMMDRINKNVRRYLNSEITLKQFTEWFITETWDVESEAGQNTAQYAHRIDSLLIRHSKGFINTFKLKNKLESMLPKGEKKLDN